MAEPKCSKCQADTSHFLIWNHHTSAGKAVLLYCDACGSILGVL